jgi:hypothetical protein
MPKMRGGLPRAAQEQTMSVREAKAEGGPPIFERVNCGEFEREARSLRYIFPMQYAIHQASEAAFLCMCTMYRIRTFD